MSVRSLPGALVLASIAIALFIIYNGYLWTCAVGSTEADISQQPTSFTLSTHTLPSVFETPELISSLAAYSEARQTADSSASSTNSGTNVEHGGERQASVLFLRIQAAADFFADDAALMSAPPAVLADVILDPYVGGVIPRSLVPTVCYVLVIAMAAWLVSKYVVGWVADMNGGSEKASKDQEVSVDAEGEERNAGVVRRKRRRVA